MSKWLKKKSRRYSFDYLPTWVDQSQDLMLRSTVSFPIITYSRSFSVFQSSFRLHLVAHSPFLLVICFDDAISTLTITEPSLLECEDFLIPTRSNACVARKYFSFKSQQKDRENNKAQVPYLIM